MRTSVRWITASQVKLERRVQQQGAHNAQQQVHRWRRWHNALAHRRTRGVPQHALSLRALFTVVMIHAHLMAQVLSTFISPSMVINMAHSLWFDFSLYFFLFFLSVPVFLFHLELSTELLNTKCMANNLRSSAAEGRVRTPWTSPTHPQIQQLKHRLCMLLSHAIASHGLSQHWMEGFFVCSKGNETVGFPLLVSTNRCVCVSSPNVNSLDIATKNSSWKVVQKTCDFLLNNWTFGSLSFEIMGRSEPPFPLLDKGGHSPYRQHFITCWVGLSHSRAVVEYVREGNCDVYAAWRFQHSSVPGWCGIRFQLQSMMPMLDGWLTKLLKEVLSDKVDKVTVGERRVIIWAISHSGPCFKGSKVVSHSHRTGEIGTISIVQFSKNWWRCGRAQFSPVGPEDRCLPASRRVVCGVASQLSSLLSARVLTCVLWAACVVCCTLFFASQDSRLSLPCNVAPVRFAVFLFSLRVWAWTRGTTGKQYVRQEQEKGNCDGVLGHLRKPRVGVTNLVWMLFIHGG